MADEILKRDQNFVTVLGGVTDDSDQDIIMLRVDPITKRLLVSATISGGGAVFTEHPTGTVDGVNQDFTFAHTPAFIVVDGGRSMMATSSDGTVNYTNVGLVYTLTIAPTFDIFSVY